MNTTEPKNDTPTLCPFRLEEAKQNKDNVVTRDGKPAVYVGHTGDSLFPHLFRVDGRTQIYTKEGRYLRSREDRMDLFMTTPEPLPATPWTLPPPPAGREWHRTDWTQDMFPEGWRPLLKGECAAPGDEVYIAINREWITQDVHSGICSGIMCKPTRTTRPLPAQAPEEQEKAFPCPWCIQGMDNCHHSKEEIMEWHVDEAARDMRKDKLLATSTRLAEVPWTDVPKEELGSTTDKREERGKDILARITQYLSAGGMFNPELAIHGFVGQLIIDCRDTITFLTRERDEAREKAAKWDMHERKKCEHCGSSEHLHISHMPCPGCGAPQCCQICCREENLRSRAESAEALVEVLERELADAKAESQKWWERCQEKLARVKELEQENPQQIQVIDFMTTEGRNLIVGAAKWLTRIAMRYEQLPKSFTDNIPATSIKQMSDKLRELASPLPPAAPSEEETERKACRREFEEWAIEVSGININRDHDGDYLDDDTDKSWQVWRASRKGAQV